MWANRAGPLKSIDRLEMPVRRRRRFSCGAKVCKQRADELSPLPLLRLRLGLNLAQICPLHLLAIFVASGWLSLTVATRQQASQLVRVAWS